MKIETRQLARITLAQMSECQRSIALIERLCSFELAPTTDYLDLDRADDAIIRLCEHTRVGDITALRRAVSADAEVNPAYRHQPYTVMEQPRSLRDVATIAAALRDIDLDLAFSRPPSHSTAIKETLAGTLTEFIGDPCGYITDHFHALRDFSTGAADRNLAIVTWAD